MAALSNENYGKGGSVAKDETASKDAGTRRDGAPSSPQNDAAGNSPQAITTDQEANAERKPDGRFTSPAPDAAVTSTEDRANNPERNDQGPAAPQLHPELHEQGKD